MRLFFVGGRIEGNAHRWSLLSDGPSRVVAEPGTEGGEVSAETVRGAGEAIARLVRS